MRPIYVTTSDASGGAKVSAPIPLDIMQVPFAIGIGCVVTGTVNYTVEHTYDNINDPAFNPATATWFANSGISAKTANADGNYAFPVRAMRLNQASGTGSVTMCVLQGVGGA